MRLISVIFSLVLSQTAFSSKNYYDYIYKKNATALYDVSSEKDFLAKKHEAYGEVIWDSLWPLINAATGYYTYQIYCTRNGQIPGQAIPQAATLGAFGFFIASIFHTLVSNMISPYIFQLQEPFMGFVNSCRNHILGPPNDELKALELQYIRTKSQLTAKSQLAIESRFKRIRTQYGLSHDLMHDDGKEDPTLRAVKHILAIPTVSKQIGFNRTAFFEEFLSYQDMASTDPLSELERFAKSLASASHHTNPKLKSHLYLQGPPGVGKTSSVIALVNEYQERHNFKTKSLIIQNNASEDRGVDI
ncbi:MAG: hypothetical protein WCK49_05995, partial [Myxococcaceae bacterium]